MLSWLLKTVWGSPISVSVSWRQVLYITGGAKEMTSCSWRGWKRSPDMTVMTKELLGNIGVHRGQKRVWRLYFLSSCSSQLPLLAHQPSPHVWNSPLTCLSFFFFFCPECRAGGWGRKFSKLVVIQRVEDKSLCWHSLAQQSHISISLVGFQLTLGLVH